jgi:dihydroflavonol-4-reductase
VLTVVTGASGHIGANLVRALVEQGRDVRVLVHEDTRAVDGLSVERVDADILDENSLHTAFAGAEIVHHLAARITLAYGRDDAAWRTNVDGTRNVVNACRVCDVRRLVHYSSIHAFSAFPVHETIDESRARAEQSAPIYDRSKAAAELEVLHGIEAGLDAVIVNPTAVIGPNDFKPSAMGKVLLDLAHRRMPALVSGGFNWVDARDVALGAISAESKGHKGGNYLLGGHYRSFEELAEMVEDVTGVPKPGLTIPVWAAMLGVPFAALASKFTGKEPKFTRASLRAVSHHQAISHEKSVVELGYVPRPLRHTLEDTFIWFRERGAV